MRRTLSDAQPKSVVMGYTTNDSFDKENVIVISALVEERLYTKHINALWSEMLALGDDGWRIFEAYTRGLMATISPQEFTCRQCVGKSDSKYNDVVYKTLGGCAEIRLVLNTVAAAAAKPKVLFHSVNASYELIDFMYQDGNNHFHAFQATIGKSHKAERDKIEKLHDAVGSDNKLSIYYLVPGKQFGSFVTTPVNPKEKKSDKSQQTANPKEDVVLWDVWHVMIPDPNGETGELARGRD
jgi:Fe-S cluster assembly scaffold protein SufB